MGSGKETQGKIRWNGISESGKETNIIWGNNPYTWGDIVLVLDIVRGGSRGYRKLLEDKEKKKRLIRLICRVKGEKIYDETKEVEAIQIKMEDIELVVNEVLGKITVEAEDVL